MTILPNPFDFSAPDSPSIAEDEAAASTANRCPPPNGEMDAAADIADLLMYSGQARFVLDEAAFMAALEDVPLFLRRTA